jgi:predicted RNA-binding Zn-ribbon protein involved in translation (DUF1610 family)
MAKDACEHCGTPILHTGTKVTQDGKTFCCRNCAAAAGTNASMGTDSCAHCGTPIVWRETIAERAGQTYCCENCADAVAPTTGTGRARA